MNMTANMSKLALVIGAMVITGGAWATDSGTGTIGATASILPACEVGTAVALNFGSLSMFNGAGARSTASSASTGGGSFSAICTNGTVTPKLTFTSASGDATTNFSLVGADTTTLIAYTLTGGGNPIVWNQAAAFTGLAGDGAAHALSIAGAIASSEKIGKLVQAYSDTITVTSSYGP